MALTQKYGIKYPFSSENDDGTLMDLNGSLTDGVKSQVLHVIFTPKGQRLRNPDFGTDLIKYIFGPRDGDTFSAIKDEISSQVAKYAPSVEFRDIAVYEDENDDHGIVVTVEYGVRKGKSIEITTTAVKL